MQVFAQRFLETASNDEILDNTWDWQPHNPDAKKIFASGAKTNTNISTYAGEKDEHGDSDNPQEGMLIAA